VEVAHFQQPAPLPDDLAAIPGPRLVFVGGIDDRVDFELVEELALLRPDWSIVMIGPQLYVDAAERLTQPNIHLFGPLRSVVAGVFSGVPAVCEGVGVALRTETT
jgi:UDP-galactopyranose mutase